MAQALTSTESVVLLVGVPLGLFMLIALAVAGPAWSRTGRYRPGLGWDAEPVWFNGPDPAGAAGDTGTTGNAAATGRGDEDAAPDGLEGAGGAKDAADAAGPGGTGGARAGW